MLLPFIFCYILIWFGSYSCVSCLIHAPSVIFIKIFPCWVFNDDYFLKISRSLNFVWFTFAIRHKFKFEFRDGMDLDLEGLYEEDGEEYDTPCQVSK